MPQLQAFGLPETQQPVEKLRDMNRTTYLFQMADDGAEWPGHMVQTNRWVEQRLLGSWQSICATHYIFLFGSLGPVMMKRVCDVI